MISGSCQLLVSLQVIPSSGSNKAEDDMAMVHKGTFYVVVKEIMKTNHLSEINVTGYSVKVRNPTAGAGTHGFDLTKEPQDFCYQIKDKESKEHSAGNVGRHLLKKQLNENFGWLWRFTFEKVHAKLTARKVFCVLKQDVKLLAGKPVQITCDK